MDIKVGFFLSVFSLLIVGCLSPKETSTQGNDAVITQEMIREKSSAATLYEAVRDLRPIWLRARGPSDPNESADKNHPTVYIDEMRRRGSPADVLRNIQAQSVERVEYLGAGEATTKFGGGNAQGAILVYTQ